MFRTDIPICCTVYDFTDMLVSAPEPEKAFSTGAQAHAEWLTWSTPKPSDAILDLGQCVATMRETLSPDSIICNGAGNFSGWWHRYWHYGAMPSQLAPTAGAMGYGIPAAVAAALRHPERTVIAVAGDGDFMMNGQELATAAQYERDMLVLVVDNSTYGTIRMHQEREYPARLSATSLTNPDFAMFGKSFGAWTATVEKTEEFAPALAEAMHHKGIRLLHLKTDIEQIAASGATVSGLRVSPQ